MPRIRLFAMDVDGTLSTGVLALTAAGGETKTFHVRDGVGIKLLPRVGIVPAIISGRASDVTSRRAAELGIEHVHQAVADKADCLLELCRQLGFAPEQAAFAGDDLSDLPAMQVSGWSGAPADAVAEVRDAADFVSEQRGGEGAVRAMIERLLVDQGLWAEVIEGLRLEGARRPS